MNLSFLIPTYNANEYLSKNFEMWKSLSSHVKLVFIEDNKTEASKEIISKIGGEYFSKENGNWGSVINFAKENKIIKTKYVAIVDPDDLININDLDELINTINDKDLYITNQLTRNVITEETKIFKPRNNIFVHVSWFKTEILYKLNNLPENISYTDTLLMQDVLSHVKSVERLNLTPYIYNIGFPNQSMAIKWDSLKEKMITLKEFESYSNKINNSIKYRKLQKRSEISSRYVSMFLMMGSYATSSKIEKKEIKKEFKKISFLKRPVTTWLLWKRLELFFIR